MSRRTVFNSPGVASHIGRLLICQIQIAKLYRRALEELEVELHPRVGHWPDRGELCVDILWAEGIISKSKASWR